MELEKRRQALQEEQRREKERRREEERREEERRRLREKEEQEQREREALRRQKEEEQRMERQREMERRREEERLKELERQEVRFTQRQTRGHASCTETDRYRGHASFIERDRYLDHTFVTETGTVTPVLCICKSRCKCARPLFQVAERQRRMEWERTKWEELHAQSEKEKRDIERLTARKRSLELELEAVVRFTLYIIYHITAPNDV